MSSSAQKPTPQQVRAACVALAVVLGKSTKYAILGGAACQLLGSTRTTEDVDFVVPAGAVVNARALIAAAKDYFTVDSRTRHTHYKSSPQVEVEILSPPGTFKESFNATTSTYAIDIDGVSIEILHPAFILNAKCRSVLGRATEAKKRSDAEDIMFLLYWLTHRRLFPTAQNVPNASKEFVEWFIATYGGSHYWTNAGYNQQTGSF